MLQPLQLEEVSKRYAEEISELRAFLLSTVLSLGTGKALAETAARVREDRGFRRDLTSYVWAIQHGAKDKMSYAQLLGVLAVAAAGAQFAAAADENDAHELLRFVMEASRSFDSARSPTAAPLLRPVPVALPVLGAGHAPVVKTVEDADSRPSERVVLSLDRRAVYGAVAAFLLLLLVSGTWWLHKEGGKHNATAAPEVQAAVPAVMPLPKVIAQPGVPAAVPEASAREAKRRAPLGMTRKERVSTSRAGISSPPPVTVRQPAAPVAAVKLPPVKAPTTNANKPPATVAAAPVPSGSEEVAADMPADFHLLRRPGDPKNVPPPAGPPKPGPVVRPTSLGVMAGHVIYSPTPEYPKAASDAHVQGEVKVEAEIDRKGNVTSTRVISGPPLLRQAALDAIGRWQYRPYLDRGRDPVGVNTTILVDFELP